jgi:ribosomal 50S subunit-recycling heat shock protein
MEINEYILKLTGAASLLEPLENDKDYLISVDGSIVKKSEEPNDDGTMNITFTFKPKTIEILKDNGQTIKSKDIRRNSQKLRAMIYYLYQESGTEMEQEEFYDKFMGKLMSHFEGVVAYLKSIK